MTNNVYIDVTLGYNMKLQDIKHELGADSISKKDGVITIRRGYFYRMNNSEQKIAEKVKVLFPNAEILDMGDHYASFRGGQSVAQGSHFWVKFKLEEEIA